MFECIFCRSISIPGYDVFPVTVRPDKSHYFVYDVLVCVISFVRY